MSAAGKGEDDLFERWCRGDRAAGSALLKGYEASLRAYFAPRAREATEDLIQQTMMRCVEARGRFRRDSSFRTFVHSIARFALAEHTRRQRRLTPTSVDVRDIEDKRISQGAAVGLREQHRDLLNGLRRMSDSAQRILQMHFWEEMTGPQIATALQIPLDTAYSRLRRAKQELRVRMLAEATHPNRDTLPDLDTWADQVATTLRTMQP